MTLRGWGVSKRGVSVGGKYWHALGMVIIASIGREAARGDVFGASRGWPGLPH